MIVKNKQQGSTKVLIVIGILLIIAAVSYYFIFQNTTVSPTTNSVQPATTVAPVATLTPTGTPVPTHAGQINGTLSGKATITQAVSKNCPTPTSNSAFGIKIYNGSTLVKQLKFNADGSYKVTLVPGTYMVYGDTEQPGTVSNPDMWRSTMPQKVTITSGSITTLNLSTSYTCNSL